MPRVRPYDPGQVRPAPVPGTQFSPNATAASFGGADARNLQAAGAAGFDVAQGLDRMAQVSALRRDKSVARDVNNQASAEVRQYLSDVYARKGRDAISVYDEAQRQLTDIYRRNAQQLKSPIQREYFEAAFFPQMQSHLDRVTTFQQRARETYETDTIQAENLNAISDAVAARTDPDAIASAEAVIKANTQYLTRGQDPAVRERERTVAVHSLHTEVLDALTKDDPRAAHGYLEKNWDKFEPVSRETLRSQLAEASRAKQIDEVAQSLAGSGLPIESQLAQVDKVKDPEVKKDLREEVKRRFDEREAMQKRALEQRVEAEWDRMFQNPGGYEVPLDLPAKEQKALRDYRHKVLTEPDTSDLTLVERLMAMPDDDFVNEDLSKYVRKLSDSDYRRFREQQKTLRGSDETFSIRTAYQTVTAQLEGMKDFKIDSKKPDEDNVKRRQRLIAQFEKRMAAVPEADRTEIKAQEVLDDLLTPVPRLDLPDFLTPWVVSEERTNRTLDRVLGTTYKFEVPYMDTKDRNKTLERLVPENLRQYPNVAFDPDRGQYYVEGDDVIDFYDSTGAYVTSFRRVE